jgi:DNA-binding transcriptional LysR family regulator
MIQPDLLSLKAFVSVAREGTVSRAADTLHLTQPAVSLQLKSLQERIRLPLFERNGRGLVLTRDGAALLTKAEKVLTALQDFSHSAQSLRETVRGNLRIGTILDPEFIRLGAFLKTLVETAPQVETALSQHISGDVRSRMMRGDLDVGFYLATRDELAQMQHPAAGNTPTVALEPQNPYFFEGNQLLAQKEYAQEATELIALELTQFSYRVLAPAGWGPQVLGRDWRALAALPWIVTPPSSAHHRLLQAALQPLGLQLRRAALVDQEASMLDLVRSGVGLSLARESIALQEVQSRGLVVADRAQLACCLCFIYRRTQVSSAPVRAALDALQKVW